MIDPRRRAAFLAALETFHDALEQVRPEDVGPEHLDALDAIDSHLVQLHEEAAHWSPPPLQ